jgi:hypothetical protein
VRERLESGAELKMKNLQALKLIAAFARIKDRETQEAIVLWVETLARQGQRWAK